MIRHSSLRHLTGKTTPTMIEDSWALEELREQQQKRNKTRNNAPKRVQCKVRVNLSFRVIHEVRVDEYVLTVSDNNFL